MQGMFMLECSIVGDGAGLLVYCSTAAASLRTPGNDTVRRHCRHIRQLFTESVRMTLVSI